MKIALRTLDSADAGFRAAFAQLLDRAQQLDQKVEGVVRDVITDVRTRGDGALVEYTAKFDRWSPTSAAAVWSPACRRGCCAPSMISATNASPSAACCAAMSAG